MKRKNLLIIVAISPVIAGFLLSLSLSLVYSTDGVPGLGGSLSVEKNFTGDRYEYIESENEVRHPHIDSYYQDGEEKSIAIPNKAPFKLWGGEECSDLAGLKLSNVVERRVKEVASMEGIIFGMDRYDRHFVEHTISKNGEGEITTGPDISYWRLVLLTPGSINCTLHVDGETYSSTVKVTVGKAVFQDA